MLLLSDHEAKKIIDDAQFFFTKEGLSIDTKILKGIDTADTILEFSKNYDLIVMGARGKTEKDPYSLGSVTKKVVRHASCPTLFTKKACSLSNLLVCIDGSETSVKALNYALKLSCKIGSQITLLNIQERRFIDLSSKDAVELGEHILSKALGTAEKGDLKIGKIVKYGVASEIIVEVAEKGDHDLIVLGNRGLGGVKRFLLGSVSDDVSHKAKTSVLIYPGKHT
jgi:nucleotide-binding universal stress UspA family protein